MNAAMKSQRLDDVSLMARLYRVVLTDVAFHAGVKASEANRDIKYLTTRLSSEGISFATKVLPQLGKATLSAFQSGRFTRPSSFKARGSGALPSFLYGLTKQLFNNDGLLKDLSTEDGVDKAVWGIEQICFLFYKYELPYAPNLVEEKYQNLKQVNDELPKTLSDFDLDYTDRTVLALAGTIIQDLMADVDLQTIIPNCGPGSTATGNVSRNEKISKIMRSSSVPGYPKGIMELIWNFLKRIAHRVGLYLLYGMTESLNGTDVQPCTSFQKIHAVQEESPVNPCKTCGFNKDKELSLKMQLTLNPADE